MSIKMGDKLVVDTNVFVESFFGPEENASCHLLTNLEELNIRLLFSQDTVGELFYILKRTCNELGLELEDAQDVLFAATQLFQQGKSINTNYHKHKIDKLLINDENDQMFVDTAFAGNATHLVTFDMKSGILGLKKVPFFPCTPHQYLQIRYSPEPSS
ncbi:putative toxin-antitoxin system toxin component, PIN family [Bacillus sp. BA3]|nr:putative toxin-antitoxin system toxin component, PIN family [Bacillus sp. BA3]